MRPSQKPNRARGRGQRKPNGNNINRVYESSGPEGKVRGTPQQIIEKYLSLARDAQTSGHRVVAENFLQHAEHYQRLLTEAMGARQERPDHRQPGPDQSDADQPDSFELAADSAVPAAGSGDQPREGSTQDDGRRGSMRERRSGGRDARESEVSGLTMIDSGNGDADSLLVDAEDLSASQPKRRPRRRDQEQAETPAPAEADAQPE